MHICVSSHFDVWRRNTSLGQSCHSLEIIGCSFWGLSSMKATRSAFVSGELWRWRCLTVWMRLRPGLPTQTNSETRDQVGFALEQPAVNTSRTLCRYLSEPQQPSRIDGKSCALQQIIKVIVVPSVSPHDFHVLQTSFLLPLMLCKTTKHIFELVFRDLLLQLT